MGAAFCFSFNDLGIKLVSDDYAVHQVVLIRSLVGMATFLAIIMPLAGGWRVIRTRRLGAHLARGTCVVIANTMLFLGLAALPIADAVAIYFVSPMVIAVFSVIFLSETVGPRRWLAIGIGFIGVMMVVKPGTTAFQLASLLPAMAAVFYAGLHIISRHIGDTESAATMAFYILVTFILFSSGMGLLTGDGRFAGAGGPALEFLLRAWAPIDPSDWPVLIMLGVTGVAGGYLIGQAYRLAEAAYAAPFDYLAMIMAIIWGITVFDTWPDWLSWAGMALILGSGLFLLWRETVKARMARRQAP
jgi:drug/metabolite transporter (DMT)-like permease